MKFKSLIVFLLSAIILATCGGGESLVASTATPLPAATPTVTPTPLPPTVVLVTQGAADAADLPRIQQAIGALADSSGFILETRDTITTADLGVHQKIIILLSAPAELGSLVSAAPETQFAVMASGDQLQAPNLTTIQPQPEMRAFLAGYAVSILAADWRAMGLLPGNSNLPQAFENGGHYYCGTCSPVYPPYVRFPLVGTMPAGSDAGSWISAASQLIPGTIYVAYVDPQAASPELYNYLVSQNVLLLGGTSPLPEALPRWAATLREDIVFPLQVLWPQLVSGSGGQVVKTSLVFTDVNPAFFSDGRLNSINEIIPILRQGLILPLDLP